MSEEQKQEREVSPEAENVFKTWENIKNSLELLTLQLNQVEGLFMAFSPVKIGTTIEDKAGRVYEVVSISPRMDKGQAMRREFLFVVKMKNVKTGVVVRERMRVKA